MKPSHPAFALGCVLAACACAVAVGAVIWRLTGGLQSFTSESWRRAAVLASPIPIPRVALQDQNGQPLRLDELCAGRVLVVDFIYTQCPTICKAQGAGASQLAQRLAAEGAEGATVLSVSFDPERDTPARLRAFKQRMEPEPTPWRLARPLDEAGRKRLLEAFGVVVIPDGLGGYDHNAAWYVVDRQCRLARILDSDGLAPAQAAARLLAAGQEH